MHSSKCLQRSILSVSIWGEPTLALTAEPIKTQIVPNPYTHAVACAIAVVAFSFYYLEDSHAAPPIVAAGCRTSASASKCSISESRYLTPLPSFMNGRMPQRSRRFNVSVDSCQRPESSLRVSNRAALSGVCVSVRPHMFPKIPQIIGATFGGCLEVIPSPTSPAFYAGNSLPYRCFSGFKFLGCGSSGLNAVPKLILGSLWRLTPLFPF